MPGAAQTLLPIAYHLCNQLALGSVSLGFIFGVLWVNHMLVVMNTLDGTQEENLAEALRLNWFELVIMLVCFASAVTAINKVN